ncbi:G patch domain-containing protein 2 [Sarotherodon galilaeus]
MRRKRSSRSIFRDLYDVIERRRREGGPRLIQLDSLTRRSRTLTLLFQGTLQTRLLALARECGRWDDVNANHRSTAGMRLLVSEWEGFEAQREELVIWLADMDVHLSEVDQLTGNTCEKLKQPQVWGCFNMTSI